MSIIKFPTKLPPPERLDLPRAELCGLLQDLAGLALERANELMDTDNAAEFADVVRRIAEDTAKANAGWKQRADQIRQSWNV